MGESQDVGDDISKDVFPSQIFFLSLVIILPVTLMTVPSKLVSGIEPAPNELTKPQAQVYVHFLISLSQNLEIILSCMKESKHHSVFETVRNISSVSIILPIHARIISRFLNLLEKLHKMIYKERNDHICSFSSSS